MLKQNCYNDSYNYCYYKFALMSHLAIPEIFRGRTSLSKHARISHLVLSLQTSRRQGVFALFVASCPQVCNKLLSTCNNPVGIIKLSTNRLSSLYVCMVNTIYLFSIVETPRKFIIAELSIRMLGSSSLLLLVLILLALMKIRACGSKALP